MDGYWEKLVDLYVDGECSNEERLAVEERAKVDRRVGRTIRETKELSVLLRAIPNKVPKEFETRLRDAIWNSPVWDEKSSRQGRQERAISASRTGGFFTKASRRVLNPVGVGIAASLLACVGALWAFLTLTKDRATDQVPLAETKQTIEKATSDDAISEPWKLIPSPEGNLPDSASKAESQENYWSVVRVDDKAQAKKLQRILQARCAELSVSFSKFGDDAQYRLNDVSKEQWLQIVDDWKDADFERSSALAKWEEETQENQTIRVEFKTSEK